MSEHTKSTSHGGAGRALLWVAILLTLALLSFVTATAVRHNPIYSDRDANGISKYRFIEECKEIAEDSEALTVGAMGQTIPLKTLVEQSSPLKTGDELRATLDAEPREIIKATQTVEGGGWTLTAPAAISIHNGARVSTLGQLPMACTHDKKTGKTTATLNLPGQ
ncbi:hypothetical protein LAJ19_01300 [Deinococcus taeanensis]|uniref:hypothetical protein n=1 Tax=Deinococcus taeanensis TaxID=2737050 RepID=UPI001CDD6622|nr:hypothetical protein [Deinococcus taeanensis]UBV42895.1 hypothetical protein LAJ19_01300 [Deinococcus taeanensis]